MNYLRGYTERGIGYDLATKTFFLLRPNPKSEAWLDGQYERTPDRMRWIFKGVVLEEKKPASAPPEKWTLRRKASSASRAVASGRKATDEVYARRMLSCLGDATTPPCPGLDPKDDKNYCKDCGCGRAPWTELSFKNRFTILDCPRKRPGFSNEVKP